MKLQKCGRCKKEYAVLIDSKFTHQNPQYKSVFTFVKMCTTCFMILLEHERLIDNNNLVTATGTLLAKENV